MRLPFLLRNRNFYFMLVMDALLVCAALVLAYYFRFDFDIPNQQRDVLINSLPIFLGVKLVLFYWCGLYYGMWRYTGLRDLRNVFAASLLSSLVILLVLFQFQKLGGIPRSVLIMDSILTFMLIGSLRVSIRLIMSNLKGFVNPPFLDSSRVRRMAVIGAGGAGEAMVREMLSNPNLKMRPSVLFDDDSSKRGKTMHGCRVAGKIDQIVNNTMLFDEILIALPSVRGERMRRIVDLCEKTGKPYKVMPAIGEMIDGRVSVKISRPIRFEDLLGREEIHLDEKLIKNSYSGKKVMVTGAGGSIGSELVRQIGRFKPEELVLVDFSEYNLYRIDLQARQLFLNVNIRSELVDIRDRGRVEWMMEKTGSEVVLHAAAYKHVPLQELNPWEAVLNNVQGTLNMVEAAQKHNVERFVLVSTDKAVRPTNVMGATKRVAEMLVECQNGFTPCRFVAVRFGNVLGSSGSVIPVFENQIAAGLPVTVTHPDVTRYFMSVSEAAQLILQAGAMAKGGELFILDMGRPVRIQDMARDLIRMHGLEPDKDIPIIFTGLRPGEKLYEELITKGEGIVNTRHQRIKVIRGEENNREYLTSRINVLFEASLSYDPVKIQDCLKKIVPEYRPENGGGGSEVGDRKSDVRGRKTEDGWRRKESIDRYRIVRGVNPEQ